MGRKPHRHEKGEHIGFEHLMNDATKFYMNKGYSHEEAMDIARKVAGAQNARYVKHYRGWRG